MVNYLKYGSAQLSVPRYMIGTDSKGEPHLYPSLTPKGHLSVHNGMDAVMLTSLRKGNHIKATKGELVKHAEKKAKVAKTNVEAAKKVVKAATAELKVAQNDLKVAKTRGRKPYSPEQKDQARKLRNEKAKAKRDAKKAATLANKVASTSAGASMTNDIFSNILDNIPEKKTPTRKPRKNKKK